MISVDVIKTVLLSNRLLVENVKLNYRKYNFYDDMNYVLVGVRRAGKSFLLFQRIQELLKSGKDWNDILYVNFEDDRLLGFETQDFEKILEAHASISEHRPILFLDEIQNIEGWHKFARRMADNKYQVYITGSNAKMLSSDVATTLGGRYMIKEIMPYGFSEFLSSNNVRLTADTKYLTTERARVRKYLEEYFCYGGFPECADLSSKSEYLMSVYQKIYLGDIAARNKVENIYALRMLFKKLAESVKQPISFTRLSALVSSTGTKFGKSTAINYVEYAKSAYLILPICNMADNFTERETKMKYYFIDNGIISLLTIDNRTTLLENLVALSLFRKYGMAENMVYFYNHNVEVDFVVPEDGLAIQACYTLGGAADDTYIRETSALIKLAKRFSVYQHLVVITYADEDRVIEINGKHIEVVNVGQWLLEQEQNTKDRSDVS